MEYGLSGESVRTRQTLRCDDAESDPRVNREGCRQLGIASVVVMPIVSEEQVLGVFELFSGQPRAFEPRDFSALQRLSEMVETAVKHAVAAQTVGEVEEPVGLELRPPAEQTVAAAVPVESVSVASADLMPAPPLNGLAPADLMPTLPPPEPVKIELEKAEMEMTKPGPAPKKPLFWSAAMQAPPNTASDGKTAEVTVPPVLRNLQKCQACGFPVSQGRTFCVECEEKQWRGQRLAAKSGEPAKADFTVSTPTIAVTASIQNPAGVPVESLAVTARPLVTSSSDVPADAPASDNSTLFLSSATSSESWFAANKYVLGALLVVAIVVTAIVWLR
jgi:hypothetical protein